MRFLCLHGMGTNGKIFEIQTAKVRLAIGGDHEYMFVDGTVAANPAPGVKQFASPDDEFLCYAEQGKIHDYITLYNNLKELIASEGPFDGIMAFSEGAAVAASLIVDHIRLTAAKQPSPFNFKCAIFFCAANPVDAEAVKHGDIVYLSHEQDGRVIDIPTAHVWTRNDNVHPGFGESLSGLCNPSIMEEYIHGLGHTVPGAHSSDGVFETVRAIRRTLERAAEIGC